MGQFHTSASMSAGLSLKYLSTHLVYSALVRPRQSPSAQYHGDSQRLPFPSSINESAIVLTNTAILQLCLTLTLLALRHQTSQFVLKNALKAYETQAKNGLLAHPLAKRKGELGRDDV